MIRHIVLFKFKDEIGQKKKEELIQGLKGLKSKIQLVKELEVGVDIGGKPNSYDIALNSLFETFDDLEDYAVHPEHVKVVDLVRDICESHVKVDFEF